MSSVYARYATALQHIRPRYALRDENLAAPVVLMVSGGADSVALLYLALHDQLDLEDGRGLARIARERIHVLHVHHGLRAEDADADEASVRILADCWHVPLTVVHADVKALAGESGSNIEEVGRRVRYDAAEKLADELSAQCGTHPKHARIVTAHTADDRAETFLMNVMRGSGVQGLTSIPRRRRRIVRPLLAYTHDQLKTLLTTQGISWREDLTNWDTQYLRAFVRHELLAPARAKNPQLTRKISQTCDILTDEHRYMETEADKAFRRMMQKQGTHLIVLQADRLASLDIALARRVVVRALKSLAPDARLEYHHIERILACVAAGSGSCSITGNISARIEHQSLVLFHTHEMAERPAVWLHVPGQFQLGEATTLHASVREASAGTAPLLARRLHEEWLGAAVLIDAERLGYEQTRTLKLWVDHPQPGDVLCPFGMHGQSKKLSDLLQEAGVPQPERSQVWVVRTAPQGTIVWVVGIRLDERVRCTETSKHLLELRVQGSYSCGIR